MKPCFFVVCHFQHCTFKNVSNHSFLFSLYLFFLIKMCISRYVGYQNLNAKKGTYWFEKLSQTSHVHQSELETVYFLFGLQMHRINLSLFKTPRHPAEEVPALETGPWRSDETKQQRQQKKEKQFLIHLTGLVSFSNSVNIPWMSLKSEANGA